MNKPLRILGFSASLLACGAFGFFVSDLQMGKGPSIEALARLGGARSSSAKLSGEGVFRENYALILADYEKPIKPIDLRYAGIGGMMASLGDPYTVFFPPRASAAFNEETRANFFGIGARLGADSLGAKVSEVFDDSPAFRAGLRKGMIITSVDGKTVVGTEIDKIVGVIKGPEDTIVRLGVVKPGVAKPVTLTVKRGKIVAPTVTSVVVPNTHIGLLTVNTFSEPTTIQFDQGLRKLEAGKIRGLVIDMRGNPGGLLTVAADMVGRFVEDKPVVTMHFRNGSQEVQRSPSGQRHGFRYPVAVLVDGDSASAAEIFAGNMKDYGKATLVGTRTFGKSSVQNVFPLVDNSSAKVTIAKYYLPSTGYIGRKLDEDGVMLSGGLEPDVKVELRQDKPVTIGDPATDNQLAKAIEILKAKSR